MSILKVANIHFETVGTNRIDYLGDNKVRINSGNGTVFSGSTTDALLRITQTGAGDAIRIEDSANPDATPFVVDASGAVGINGPISAGMGLTVSNASVMLQSSGPGLIFREVDAGAERTFWDLFTSDGSLRIRALTDSYVSANIAYQIDRTDAAISNHRFFTGTTQTERLRIDNSGNVLIGRTDSTVGQGIRLDVNGGINASAVLVNGSPISGGATITTDSVNATRYVVFEDSTSGSMTLANVSTSLTFNPSTGTLSSTIFNSTSDETLKYDVKPIENALAYLDEFNGVHFKWKKTNEPSLGVIAQDVEKVLPELVDNGIDHKTVNYNGIIAVLIQAVKELKAEIEVLKSK